MPGSHADGRTEDAAGHGAALVEIAAAGGGIEGRTGGLVGELFKTLTLGIGVAQQAGFGIAGKSEPVLVQPHPRAAFDFGG